MPSVIFEHPILDRPLHVDTGANQINWGYGLNTQVTPTYGGEVVQILSAYINDLSIEGEVRTYAKCEQIYAWFLEYMQAATQGGFNEAPVRMRYPERGWNLKIRPLALPGFRYGTEVVAPTWKLSANVAEADPNMTRLTLEEAISRNFDFSRISAGIGYDQSNPWTDPAAKDSKYDPKDGLEEVSDFYNELIPSYLEGDFKSLFVGFYGSGPASNKDRDRNNKDQEQAAQNANGGRGDFGANTS